MAPDPSSRFDAVVVGAGPAGSAAAATLAAGGARVALLDRSAFPRDKACGDGLTRHALRRLERLGVLDRLPGGEGVRALSLRLLDGRERRLALGDRDPGYLVVPRAELDEVLRSRAVELGAAWFEGTNVVGLVRDVAGRCLGVHAERAGRACTLHAAVTIVAAGAASRLAGDPGMPLGFAVRGYYRMAPRRRPLELVLALRDTSGRFKLPAYGWVFPVDDERCNIGVGVVHRARDANVRELMRRFVSGLETERAEVLEPLGAWRGAPLRFDFSAERCAAAGLLVAGDAAGLVSPFTGEGISYAMESGVLAAEAVLAAPSPPTGQTERRYREQLHARYGAYMAAGREAGRKHLVVWRLLEDSFDVERPFFSLCRRAAILPGGAGQDLSKALPETGRLAGRLPLAVRGDLVSVSELIVASLRDEWPFLARLLASSGTADDVLRPALLVLLANEAAGRPHADGRVAIAAAADLVAMAALAQGAVVDGEGHAFANAAALLLGDFLVAQAARAVQPAASYATSLVVEWLTRLCGTATRAAAVDPGAVSLPEQLDLVERGPAALTELACRLGALGSQEPAVVEGLAAYGRHLGVAVHVLEDVQGFRGQATRLGTSPDAQLRAGELDVTLLLALERAPTPELARLVRVSRDPQASAAREQVVERVRRDGAVPAALRLVSDRRRLARDALPDGLQSRARTALLALAETGVEQTVIP